MFGDANKTSLQFRWGIEDLVVNITMALLAAFVGGYIARRIGMPTLVGYLLGGLAIGPFTPGFVGDIASVSQLAEMGVIFMLFGVGLHFSLKDLWAVRKVAIPGAVLQIVLATALGYGLTQLWGWTTAASLVVGLAISVASTVVLLRGLVDNGMLNSIHGQTAVNRHQSTAVSCHSLDRAAAAAPAMAVAAPRPPYCAAAAA